MAGPAIVSRLLISGAFCALVPGTKINSRSCKNIGASAVFGITRQNHFNHAPICASVLCEISDLHEMVARHRYFKSRIGALDDLAFKRVGEGNRCGSKKNRSDEKSHAERFHV